MKWLKVTSFILLAGALASCGGGGDVAGDTAEFFTSPDEMTFTRASCVSGGMVLVTIVGGTPPYRIQNPSPHRLQVDRTEVSGKDPNFRITTIGGCIETSILVLDYHSRTTAIDITVEDVE